eukprot:3869131-Prymnesium_polylepis.1
MLACREEGWRCHACPETSVHLLDGLDCATQNDAICSQDHGCSGRTWKRCRGTECHHDVIHELNLSAHSCRRGCPIRWLHIPKCGSTFGNTVFRYGCERLDTAHGSCPRLLSTDVGHQPLETGELGHVVANFRHPRARIASFCRRGEGHSFRTHTEFTRCTSSHVRHSHLGVMVRLILGIRLPGVGNGAERLAPLAPSLAAEGGLLRDALVRLRDGFAFVGLTEAWEESVRAFHQRFMPEGAAPRDNELWGEGHFPPGVNISISDVPSGKVLLERHDDLLQSNKVEVELRYDRLWFADNEDRVALRSDPDLLIFAHARLAFCRWFASHAQPPAVCVKSLGALVEGTAQEQRAWARHLVLLHWGSNTSLDIGQPRLEAVIESLAGEDVSHFS